MTRDDSIDEDGSGNLDDDVLDALRYQLREAFSTRIAPPFSEYGRPSAPVIRKQGIPDALKLGLLAGLSDGRTYDEVRAAWRAGEDIVDVLELSGTTSDEIVDRAVRTRDADDPDPSYLGDSTFDIVTIDLREITPEDVR